MSDSLLSPQDLRLSALQVSPSFNIENENDSEEELDYEILSDLSEKAPNFFYYVQKTEQLSKMSRRYPYDKNISFKTFSPNHRIIPLTDIYTEPNLFYIDGKLIKNVRINLGRIVSINRKNMYYKTRTLSSQKKIINIALLRKNITTKAESLVLKHILKNYISWYINSFFKKEKIISNGSEIDIKNLTKKEKIDRLKDIDPFFPVAMLSKKHFRDKYSKLVKNMIKKKQEQQKEKIHNYEGKKSITENYHNQADELIQPSQIDILNEASEMIKIHNKHSTVKSLLWNDELSDTEINTNNIETELNSDNKSLINLTKIAAEIASNHSIEPKIINTNIQIKSVNSFNENAINQKIDEEIQLTQKGQDKTAEIDEPEINVMMLFEAQIFHPNFKIDDISNFLLEHTFTNPETTFSEKSPITLKYTNAVDKVIDLNRNAWEDDQCGKIKNEASETGSSCEFSCLRTDQTSNDAEAKGYLSKGTQSFFQNIGVKNNTLYNAPGITKLMQLMKHKEKLEDENSNSKSITKSFSKTITNQMPLIEIKDKKKEEIGINQRIIKKEQIKKSEDDLNKRIIVNVQKTIISLISSEVEQKGKEELSLQYLEAKVIVLLARGQNINGKLIKIIDAFCKTFPDIFKWKNKQKESLLVNDVLFIMNKAAILKKVATLLVTDI